MRIFLLSFFVGLALTAQVGAGPSQMQTITDLAFNSDGSQLAVAGTGPGARFENPGMVEVWDLKSRSVVLTVKGKERFTSVDFRGDGKFLLTGSEDGTVVLWSATTGKKQIALSGCSSQVWDVAFSPSGRRVAAASGWSGGLAIMWSVGPGSREWSKEDATDPYYSVAFSPDGNLLAAGNRKREAKVWLLATGEEILDLKDHAGWVTELAFSPQGTPLAAGAGSEVRLYDITSGELERTLKDEQQQLHSLAWFPDGRRLAAGGIDYENSGSSQARVWDVTSGEQVYSLGGHRGIVQVAVHPEGDILATGDDDGKVRLWEAATGAAKGTL